MRTALTMFAALALAVAGSATAATRVVHEHVPAFLDPVRAGVVVGDFEGSGRDDAAITGYQREANGTIDAGEPRSGFVAIIHYDAALQSYGIARTLITDDGMLAGVAVDPLAAPEPGFVTVSQDGMVTRYAGSPPAQVARFTLQRGALAMAIGDVDGDGSPEVVVNDLPSGLAAYDLATGALKKTYPGYYGSGVAVAQLDADPGLEIIVPGAPGVVLDGSSGAVDWSYAGGIGTKLATGTILAGGVPGFLAAEQSSYLTAFRSMPYTPIWSIADTNTDAVDLVDLDGEGIDEVLLSGYVGPIRIFNALTQQTLHTLSGQASGHIGAGHFEGGADWQVIYGEGINSSSEDDTNVRTLGDVSRYSAADENGAFSATATGDIDGDSQADGIWLSRYSDSMYDGGYIHVYDPASGIERWRARLTAADDTEYWFRALSGITLAPSPNGNRSDLVVAAVYFYTPELYAVDGISRKVRLSNTMPGFSNSPIYKLATIGSTVLAAGSGYPIDLGTFALADLQPLWHTTIPAELGNSLHDMKTAQLTGAGSSDALLATDTALVAYDLQAHAVLWSKLLPTESADIVVLADRSQVVGALGSDGHVRLYGLDGTELPTDFAVGQSEPGAITALPGNPGKALACVDRRIVVIDLDAQTTVEKSAWLGALTCRNGDIAVARVGETNVARVTTGSVVGAFDLIIAGEPIFSDGFDPLPQK